MKYFINDYLVDEYGNLYSSKYNKVRKLKYYVNRRGYKMYRVCVNGKVKAYSAHHISYYANVSNFDTEDGLVLDHIDGNKLNNHYSNLRRVSQKDNCNNVNTKIYGVSPTNKCNIRLDKLYELRNNGYNITQLSKLFNCSRSTIRNRLREISNCNYFLPNRQVV